MDRTKCPWSCKGPVCGNFKGTSWPPLAALKDLLKAFFTGLLRPSSVTGRQAAGLTDRGGPDEVDQQGECSSHERPIKPAAGSHLRSS